MSNDTISPKIADSWKTAMKDEFQKEYFLNLKQFLLKEKAEGKTIYPAGSNIFAAFDLCPFDKVKVVLLGQDPYHGAGQAHGLCFSVTRGTRIPPSLRNIFKELQSDLQLPIPEFGELSSWARQGVLLLNATLTVRAGEAGSHQNKGWEQFTDAVIRKISEEKSGVVFLLWGNFAKAKESLIDTGKHHVLKASHPASEVYGSGGFFNCKHFSKTNGILRYQQMEEIDWLIKDPVSNTLNLQV